MQRLLKAVLIRLLAYGFLIYYASLPMRSSIESAECKAMVHGLIGVSYGLEVSLLSWQ